MDQVNLNRNSFKKSRNSEKLKIVKFIKNGRERDCCFSVFRRVSIYRIVKTDTVPTQTYKYSIWNRNRRSWYKLHSRLAQRKGFSSCCLYCKRWPRWRFWSSKNKRFVRQEINEPRQIIPQRSTRTVTLHKDSVSE